jgi:hypothetical protein
MGAHCCTFRTRQAKAQRHSLCLEIDGGGSKVGVECECATLQSYANLDRNSGVAAYQAGRDSIILVFRRAENGEAYLYDASRPGAKQASEMQRLAKRGRGLATYVNQCVRDNYARKLSRHELAGLLDPRHA